MEARAGQSGYTWGLYCRLVAIRIRAQLQYKRSFALQVLAGFRSTFIDLATLLIFFSFVPRIGGWRLGEVALLYGMASVSFGLADMVGAGIDQFPLDDAFAATWIA